MVGIKLLFLQPIRQVHSSIDPHTVLNKFVFLHITPRCALQQLQSSPCSLFIMTHNDVISFRSAIKVKVSLGLAKVKP